MGSIVRWDTLDTKLAFSHLWRLLLPGACFVERHITLDRATWGSDQAASVEPLGMIRMVKEIRIVEKALGDGVKRVCQDELQMMKKWRRQ